MTLAIFLLALGAALRLVHLITQDSITDPIHVKVMALTHPNPRYVHPFWKWVGELIQCPWCIGFWISCGTLATAYFAGDSKIWQFAAAALTVSYLVGWAATLLTAIQGDQDA